MDLLRYHRESYVLLKNEIDCLNTKLKKETGTG